MSDTPIEEENKVISIDRRSARKPVEEKGAVQDDVGISINRANPTPETEAEDKKAEEKHVEINLRFPEDFSQVEQMLYVKLKELQQALMFTSAYIDYLYGFHILMAQHTKIGKAPAPFSEFVEKILPKMQRMEKTGIIEL